MSTPTPPPAAARPHQCCTPAQRNGSSRPGAHHLGPDGPDTLAQQGIPKALRRRPLYRRRFLGIRADLAVTALVAALGLLAGGVATDCITHLTAVDSILSGSDQDVCHLP